MYISVMIEREIVEYIKHWNWFPTFYRSPTSGWVYGNRCMLSSYHSSSGSPRQASDVQKVYGGHPSIECPHAVKSQRRNFRFTSLTPDKIDFVQHYNTSFLEGNLIRVLKLRGYLFSIIGINDGEKCAQTDVTLNAQHSTTQRLGMQAEMEL